MTVENPLLYVLAGLGAFVVTWIGWSGRWREWVKINYLLPIPRSVVLTAFPSLGLMSLATGLGAALPSAGTMAVAGIAFLGMLFLFVLMLWDPNWFGPHWYQEFKRAFADSPGGTPFWLDEDPRRSDESSMEATQRHLGSARPAPRSEKVRLIRVPSASAIEEPQTRDSETRERMWFFPHALVVTRGPDLQEADPEIIVVRESITGVRQMEDESASSAGPPGTFEERVRVETADGAWVVDTRHGKRLVREIEHRYVGERPAPGWGPRQDRAADGSGEGAR